MWGERKSGRAEERELERVREGEVGLLVRRRRWWWWTLAGSEGGGLSERSRRVCGVGFDAVL
jgi:hypothetical protein